MRLPAPLLALLFMAGSAMAAARAPEWLQPVLAGRPAFDHGKASFVVLKHEAVLTVGLDGTFTTRTRHAIRILNAEGRSHAVARVLHDSSSDKIKSLKAWLIPPSGEVTEYGSKHRVETALYSSARELYGEARQTFLSGVDDAKIGAVFAYEAIVEERSVFSDLIWRFQQQAPVESSSFTAILPEGWTVDARTFNRMPVAPVVRSNRFTWELNRLPLIEPDPLGPSSLSALVPWLAVTIRPPAAVKGVRRHAFGTWADIAAHFAPIYDAAAAPDAAITAKAAELVAGAATQWERIRALCGYAQKATYISITLNSAGAGGLIPRAASRVFACNYGDCKDKATLLRSLLRSQGIESYPLAVYAGDAAHVRPEWPSPVQFNHCILAIKIDDTVEDTPACVIDSSLGRLLIFDPTNEYLPVGLLPREDLGGRGLVFHPITRGLLSLPEGRPQNNRFERRLDVRLAASGLVEGTMQENYAGLASVRARAVHANIAPADYRARITSWLAESLPSPNVSRIAFRDDFDGAAGELSLDFQASAHGKPMRDVLLVFKPVMIAGRAPLLLQKQPRSQPVVIQAVSFAEESRIGLPAGYHIDEPFPPVALTAPFGTYQAGIRIQEDGRLLFQRHLELRDALIPLADFETVRTFFEKIQQTEQTPVVLRRKSG